jgi:hypothetical protein
MDVGTIDDGLDWPSFLVGDVPRLSRCQSPHKFRGHSKRRIIYVSLFIDFLFWKVWLRSQGEEHNIDEIDNDTSRPPSTFNVTLTWTYSHFQQLHQLHESKLLKFLLLHV